MKSYYDLKLRSKLPSRIQSEAKRREQSAGKNIEFFVELVSPSTLRFIWFVRDPETEVKQIREILEFDVESSIAKAFIEKNNPDQLDVLQWFDMKRRKPLPGETIKRTITNSKGQIIETITLVYSPTLNTWCKRIRT